MEMFDVLKEYIYPELLVLIPVLYFIGWCIHKSDKVDNKFIPTMLGGCGIILSTVYMLSILTTITVNAIFATIFAAIVQGLLCAAAAVFANQLKKQASGDTSNVGVEDN